MSNYLRKLQRVINQSHVEAGRIYEVMVYHDGWCDFLNGKGECNCDPDLKGNLVAK